MNTTEQAVSREVARLETWLACYAIDQRRNPDATIERMFEACRQTVSTQRASERGL